MPTRLTQDLMIGRRWGTESVTVLPFRHLWIADKSERSEIGTPAIRTSIFTERMQPVNESTEHVISLLGHSSVLSSGTYSMMSPGWQSR